MSYSSRAASDPRSARSIPHASTRRTWALLGCAAVLTGLVLSGCARVSVRKVPTPSQYVRWTDAMQRKADSLEGFRFYLPRPFVNVFESFPVRADIYLAEGTLSDDGEHVIIHSVRSESGLSEYQVGIATNTKLPARSIGMPSQDSLDAAQQAVKAAAQSTSEVLKAAAGAIPTGQPVSGDTQSKETPSSPPKTGLGKRNVSNDNGAFAYQPMRGNMDIVYLPDFEEQFVASSKTGLGNAEFALNLGQGWSLQSYNSLVDNSELNKRIFDVIDSSIQMAKAAAQTAAGVPPVDIAGVTKILNPKAQSLAEVNRPVGTPVSLKIVVVHYAAKGLYPVIKPRELQERSLSLEDYHLILDFVFPRVRGVSEMDPGAIDRAARAVDNESGRFTVPRYPYQFISFNTFRYMTVEVVKADAAPFGTLYDKTGTTGDPGDRRGTDPAFQPPGTRSTNDSQPSADDITAWMNQIKRDGANLGDGFTGIQITDASYSNKVVRVAIQFDDTTPDSAHAGLRDKVFGIVKQSPAVGADSLTISLIPATASLARAATKLGDVVIGTPENQAANGLRFQPTALTAQPFELKVTASEVGTATGNPSKAALRPKLTVKFNERRSQKLPWWNKPIDAVTIEGDANGKIGS